MSYTISTTDTIQHAKQRQIGRCTCASTNTPRPSTRAYAAPLLPPNQLHDIVESRTVTWHAIPTGVNDFCQIGGRFRRDWWALFLDHHAHVNVPSALVRPGRAPRENFPDYHPKAVHVAGVGSTIRIENLSDTGKLITVCRGGKGKG